ncbi:MAG: nitrogenase component 1 [Syntrophomonadaceae bacterium]|nr:nitrogenase component 1 [Syntrophomonadaceae bacterium]
MEYSPKIIFVYPTCVVGVIGDDIDAMCKRVEKRHGIRALSLTSGSRSTSFNA